MHVTIINTRHRENDNVNSYQIPFSAYTIFDKFGNIDLGICRIEDIHISKIGVHDEQGRHRSEGKHKLP